MEWIHRTRSDDDPIAEFWQWFESVAGTLARDFENPEVIEALNRRVGELGEMAWELGPGIKEENMLVLSPDGDVSRLHETRALIGRAPSLPGWEFHPARPARPSPLKFSIDTDSSRKLEVDAERWSYVLLRFKDGSTEVIVEQPESAEWSEDDRWAAAIVALDGLLGEERRLAGIDTLDIVPEMPDEYKTKRKPLACLSGQLSSLCR